MRLRYRIPDFWPQRAPISGYPVPSFRCIIGSCMRLPEDFGAQPVFPCKLYKLFGNKIMETSQIQNNAVFILGDSVYLNNYNYDTESGIINRYRQLQNRPELSDMDMWGDVEFYSR